MNSTAHKTTKKHLGLRDSTQTLSHKEANEKYIKKQKENIGEEAQRLKWKENKAKLRAKNKKEEDKVIEAVAPELISSKADDSKQTISFLKELHNTIKSIKNTKPERIPMVMERVKEKIVKQAIKLTQKTNCKSLEKEIVKVDSKAKLDTVETNLNDIRKLHKAIVGTNLECNNLSFLQDYNKIEKYIMDNKSWSKKTKSTYFARTAGILRYLPEFNDVYEKYSSKGTLLHKEYMLDKSKNELTDKQEERLNNGCLYKWSEIRALKPKALKSNNKLYKLLYLLYTEIPPRRLQDYGRMCVLRFDSMNDFNDNFEDKRLDNYNYISFIGNSRVAKMYIDKYKGLARTTHGVYEKDIKGDLFEAFKDFTKDTVDNHFIFKTENEPEDNLTEKVLKNIDNRVGREVVQMFAQLRNEKKEKDKTLISGLMT
jgi:hypothetical protein